jgi:hypothetical protein
LVEDEKFGMHVAIGEINNRTWRRLLLFGSFLIVFRFGIGLHLVESVTGVAMNFIKPIIRDRKDS